MLTLLDRLNSFSPHSGVKSCQAIFVVSVLFFSSISIVVRYHNYPFSTEKIANILTLSVGKFSSVFTMAHRQPHGTGVTVINIAVTLPASGVSPFTVSVNTPQIVEQQTNVRLSIEINATYSLTGLQADPSSIACCKD